MRAHARPSTSWLLGLLLGLALGLATTGAHAQDRVLPGQPNEAAVAAFKKGEALLAQGKLAEAAAQFDDAAKRAPLFYLAHYAAGNAFARAGNLRKAEERYKKALEINPGFAQGWNARGVVQLNAGETKEALESFDRALRADPKHAHAPYHRGAVLLQLGRPKEAETQLRAVVATQPKHIDARTSLASAVAAQGRVKESLAALAEIVAEHPKHAGAHFLRAELFVRTDRLLPAAEAVALAVQGAGDQATVRRQAANAAHRIATAARSNGDVDAQVRAMETLVSLLPKKAAAHAQLGAALLTRYETRTAATRDKRELERARRALERSLELDPDQETVRRLLEMYR